ncbi:hypothetical protein KSC_058930 [Ktedonobacter sp. SOSP1-52]|uniref:YncE family protein n=1 Tax=Ktedonobacter sp. SOSP1-52 TaxID=2778366 RepID=UPI001916B10D|nr:hypothetical protein [Ktedonobacter sp. SOSP1-52]GHO67001.1 hypothetical protein KSC_058930 [Ktedonobacter sp. SOSP1-52]
MTILRKYKKLLLVCSLLLIVLAGLAFVMVRSNQAGAQGASVLTRHYLYVVPDEGIDVYDIDRAHAFVRHIDLPMLKSGRGVVADPLTASLFISYGGNGGAHGNGSLLKYDLLHDRVVWTKSYDFGIDSMAITPDGKSIYMPGGSNQYQGFWHVLRARDGAVLQAIQVGGGAAGHNTVVGLSGKYAYLGALNNNQLYVVDTASNKVVKKVGPLKDGVRPFTVNNKETLVFTTASHFLGFEVSDLQTGQLLYSVPAEGFVDGLHMSAPSHGISLSPDEKEVYIVDAPNSYVHVFDVSGLPERAPRKVADIKLTAFQGEETPCVYDCLREGWVLHSRDGRYVYVGDSGDVIDTATRAVVKHLPDLMNTRKYLEIDWRNGIPVFTTSRQGLGYAF